MIINRIYWAFLAFVLICTLILFVLIIKENLHTLFLYVLFYIPAALILLIIKIGQFNFKKYILRLAIVTILHIVYCILVCVQYKNVKKIDLLGVFVIISLINLPALFIIKIFLDCLAI